MGRVSRSRAAVTLLPEAQPRQFGDAGVDSIQEAVMSLPAAKLDGLWKIENLERLARAYWRYLSRISLSLIRVVYEPDARHVVLLSRHLRLLSFHAPEYEAHSQEASVAWRIRRGILVAREGRDGGFLRIAVSRYESGDSSTANVLVSVQVRNFYPWIRGRGRFARFGSWLYAQTQLRIHRLVTHGFLRSLAALELPPSRAGTLIGEIAVGGTGVSHSGEEGTRG